MSIRPWRWGLGIAFGGIALLVACDGANLFDPSQNPFIEPRITLSAPSSAFAGDSITVSLNASAAQELSSVRLSVRGAATKDTTISVSGTSAAATVKFGVPSVLTDTLVYLSAVAQDKVGNQSKVRGDTMTVVGPPSILSISQPDSLKVGTTTSFKVRAFGTRRIAQLDVTLRGAISKDTTIIVSPALNDVTQTISLAIPTLVSDTAVRVGVIARDISGLSSQQATVALPLAITPPTAAFTLSGVPASVAPGANLDVTVRATAMRTVTQIGVVLTGAVSKDTAIDVLPPQGDVTRTVSVRIPADVSGTSIGVSAYSIDKSGARSLPTTVAAVSIDNSVPVITSITTQPNDSIGAGKTLDVRVVASGVRPITSIELRARGAVDNVQTVAIASKNSVTQDFQVVVPISVSDTLLTLTAVATDAAGQKSSLAGASKTVKVADLTAPSVTVTPDKTNSSAGGTVLFRIQAQDNVALRQVGYAVVNPAGDTVGTTPTLAATRGVAKDTTFSFSVPLTLTPRTVRVLGIAVDASGRRGISTATNLVIADSAAPMITFNAPALNSTLPINDSVRVQVRVQDGSGIKQIDMIGQSTRVDSLGPTRVVQRFNQKIILFPAVVGGPMPKDTTITRYLTAIPDSISEPVDIIITAKDSLGNISQATQTILVGGPRVDLRQPFTGVSVAPGGTLPIQVFAVDRASGIDSVQILVTGAITDGVKMCQNNTISCTAYAGLRSADSIVVNYNQVIPPATPAGNLFITAKAWNSRGVVGSSTSVTVPVMVGGGGDTSPPQVSISMSANDRIELRDTVSVLVQAQDVGVSGIARMGLVITATPAGGQTAPGAADTAITIYRDTLFVGSGRVGLVPKTFKITLADFGYDEVKLQRFPRGVTFTAHAFALDAATTPNCGANVTSTLVALGCSPVINVAPAPTVSGRTDYYTSTSLSPASLSATMVAGFGRQMLNPSDKIADVIVDNNPARPRLFMSNIQQNRLEWLDLSNPNNPLQTVSVGSEPWGMFLANAAGPDGLHGTADDNPTRLIVANSGGTNLSFVDISVATPVEQPLERVFTPNAVLFDVAKAVTSAGTSYLITYHDFSDRPQFIAEDANGLFVYSTKPTGASPDGTVRFLQPTGGPRPYESKILYNRDAVEVTADNWAIANIDSVTAGITLWDHTPGNPAAVFSFTNADIDVAIAGLAGLGSDIAAYPGGKWNIAKVGLSDTTYVAASGNRDFVAFGEGATGPYASVWLWRKGTGGPGSIGALSDNLTVQDLIGNSAERVLGIALNYDGQIGGARGAVSTSFFGNDINNTGDLRLQGVFSNGVAGGNGGVALHPDHASATSCTDQTLAFIATSNRSIKIVDTFHFRERGEIQIRDNIVSPLRASRPLAADNGALAANSPDYIIVKLYGVTGAGRAEIINVRRRDLTSMNTGAIPYVCQ